MTQQSLPPLRIASLLPAATDICHELGLHLVGITHECDAYENDAIILTANGSAITSDLSQGEIHQAVQDAVDIDSLYPILKDQWDKANPNLVLTQDLCAVCGPSTTDVCALNPNIRTVSLSPTTLTLVGESFIQVADACGIKNKGLELVQRFTSQLSELATIVTTMQTTTKQQTIRPKVLMLEWIDPPFDGGHWIPEMIQLAGCDSAIIKLETKSKVLQWTDILNSSNQPDFVLVACCGFDLARNIKDALASPKLKQLTCPIYAADGNQYFARPGPKLVGGVSILAQCANEMNQAISKTLQALDYSPRRGQGWERVVYDTPEPTLTNNTTTNITTNMTICDMEDITTTSYTTVHNEACSRGDFHYNDPTTGFQVFTELAHRKRGKCCGSGCRHCPYSHANVIDKVSKIQQPAFLYKSQNQTQVNTSILKVLFFSGGKDSFLALRSLMKHSTADTTIVLLTTFDATSRIIAHQEVHIQEIKRQAEHLKLSIIGIPLQRAGGENYVDRLRRGFRVVEEMYHMPITTLVFGDLHLGHIRGWREKELGSLGYQMEYPLWQVPYDELINDLETSQVPCVVNASTVDDVEVGTPFTRELYSRLVRKGTIDAFGEQGEFHSLAKVWETDRNIALGLPP